MKLLNPLINIGMRRFCAAPLSIVLLVLGAATQANAASGASAKTFLWEVKSPVNTVYIFGSIHIARPDFYPLHPAVERAYKKSKVLAVEADPTDAKEVEKMMSVLTYALPDKLENHLSKATWQKLSTPAGTGDLFRSSKPAIVSSIMAMSLFVSRGYSPESGR